MPGPTKRNDSKGGPKKAAKPDFAAELTQGFLNWFNTMGGLPQELPSLKDFTRMFMDPPEPSPRPSGQDVGMALAGLPFMFLGAGGLPEKQGARLAPKVKDVPARVKAQLAQDYADSQAWEGLTPGWNLNGPIAEPSLDFQMSHLAKQNPAAVAQESAASGAFNPPPMGTAEWLDMVASDYTNALTIPKATPLPEPRDLGPWQGPKAPVNIADLHQLINDRAGLFHITHQNRIPAILETGELRPYGGAMGWDNKGLANTVATPEAILKGDYPTGVSLARVPSIGSKNGAVRFVFDEKKVPVNVPLAERGYQKMSPVTSRPNSEFEFENRTLNAPVPLQAVKDVIIDKSWVHPEDVPSLQDLFRKQLGIEPQVMGGEALPTYRARLGQQRWETPYGPFPKTPASQFADSLIKKPWYLQ